MDLLLGFLALGALYAVIMLATHHWEGEPTPPGQGVAEMEDAVSVDEKSHP